MTFLCNVQRLRQNVTSNIEIILNLKVIMNHFNSLKKFDFPKRSKIKRICIQFWFKIS